MSIHLLTGFGMTKAPSGGGGTPTPLLTITDDSKLFSVSSSNQFGWQFTANANLSLTDLGVYVNGTATMTVRLWRVSDNAKLAEVTVSATTKAWSYTTLGSPITLVSGADYIVTLTGASSVRLVDNLASSPHGTAFSSDVTFVSTRQSTGLGYPTQDSSTFLWGQVGGLYTV